MRSQLLWLTLSGLGTSVLASGPWQQCGGQDWKGDKSCDAGWKCESQNPYYSQCLPSSQPPAASNTAPSSPQPSSPGGTSPPPPGTCGAYNGDKTGYATTTHYYDGQKGACGCGTGDTMSSWQSSPGTGLYTAAGSQVLFGGSGSWCGSGCGTCYELTNAGSIAASGQGDCTGAGETITVMISNLCPANGNQQWCSDPNQYGFSAHFDIMSQNGGPQGWNNPVVKYKEVACPGSLTSDWKTCQCASGAQSRARRGLMGDTF